MPRKHLTDIVCQTITAEKQTRYWDTKMRGFGLTVGPNTKTFIVMTGAKRQLVTIGKYPDKTLAQARKDAHRILGTHVAVDAVTFDEARTDFIEQHCKKNNRPRTAAETERLLKHLSFSSPLHKITRRDVQAAISGMPPSAANHSLVALKTLFNWCVDRGLLTATPLARARLPHASSSRDRVLSDDELARIWNAANDLDVYGSIVQVLMLTGLRRNEVAAMRNSWFGGGTIKVPKAIAKNKREHLLPIGATAEKKLLARVQATEVSSSEALVFPVPGFDTVFSGWSKMKIRLDAESSVRDWTLHDLRRTFATIHAKLKTPPHIIESLLNHASGQISGVAAVYNRYQYEDEKRAAMLDYERYVTALISPK